MSDDNNQQTSDEQTSDEQANDQNTSQRGRRKTIVGKVVSDKMDKTITVREERIIKHARYKKYIRRSTDYKAHDEQNEAHEGDVVEIVQTRPLSKTKFWRLVRVVRADRLAEARSAVGGDA